MQLLRATRCNNWIACNYCSVFELHADTRDLALASMARDDPPASSTASRRAACSRGAAMRGKVGSEFET